MIQWLASGYRCLASHVASTPYWKDIAESLALPAGRSAEVHVLFSGYLGPRTASTVTFVRDGAAQVVIDPGMVPHRRVILDPLAALGVAVDDITDVIFS